MFNRIKLNKAENCHIRQGGTNRSGIFLHKLLELKIVVYNIFYFFLISQCISYKILAMLLTFCLNLTIDSEDMRERGKGDKKDNSFSY